MSEPTVFLRSRQYLFLLSHMRSYSSVLAHVLGSHPQISGHTERQRSYRSGRDLLRLRYADHRDGGDGSSRFVLDKILHDQYVISERIFRRPDVRTIIFIREPAATLASIFRMGRDLLRDDAYCDVERNLRYYVERLETLVRYARQSSNAPLYFDAERIVQSPEEVLRVIGHRLGLSTPLSSRYEVFTDSGRTLRGDPSDVLRQGRIVPGSTSADSDTSVPSSVLDVANASYFQCRHALAEHCRTLPA